MRLSSRVLVCVAALATGRTATATAVSDAGRGFSFTLPDGYVENPGGTREPKLNLAFSRGQLDQPGYSVLQVVSLGGTIGPGKLDPAIVEKAARNSVQGTGVELTKFDYRQTRWRGFELELVVTQAKREGKGIVTLSLQVPLAKEAIQLIVAGAAEDEARLLSDLQAILSSLEGKSNWLTDAERSERLGRGVGTVVGFAVAGGVLAYLFARKRRRRPSP